MAPQVAVQFELGGEIFLRLLLMMVVPLVVASVMSSIIGLGDIRKLGRPGGFAIAYYLTTTVMAVIVGLIMVNVIQPGIGAIDADTLETMAAKTFASSGGPSALTGRRKARRSRQVARTRAWARSWATWR